MNKRDSIVGEGIRLSRWVPQQWLGMVTTAAAGPHMTFPARALCPTPVRMALFTASHPPLSSHLALPGRAAEQACSPDQTVSGGTIRPSDPPCAHPTRG